jgi:uncharacterized protein
MLMGNPKGYGAPTHIRKLFRLSQTGGARRMKQIDDTTSSAFQEFIRALAQPTAFPSEAGVASGSAITIIQTHASAVLLTEACAYKLKKPVNLEFLDYSTVERRRRFCIEECRINQPLAPGVYLGVAPVLSRPGSQPRFGPVFPSDLVPNAGESLEDHQVIDFAVVMRRLPDSRTLDSLVATGAASANLLQHVARATAAFHLAAEDGPPLAPYGSVETVMANILQTLDQSQADIGSTLSAEAHAKIGQYIGRFAEGRRELLESRLRAGWVRDCHGDLRLEHIYAMPVNVEGGEESANLLMVDRIEFDSRFRYGDVASEIAFLTIELERAGRADLARTFTHAYIAATKAGDLLEILPFYQVYRAMVRGKVRSILLRQPGVDTITQAKAREDAIAMYELAAHYAASPSEPTIAMIGGLMGTGKSTLAQALSRELGWRHISSDIVRKRMAGFAPTTPVSAKDQRSIYSATWNRRVYDRLLEESSARLAEGHSTLLDATFTQRAGRQMIANLACKSGARAVFLECVCPRDVAMSRLGARWQAKISSEISEQVTDDRRATIFASDGRPEIYDRQSLRWEPFIPEVERETSHAVIDTTWPLPRQIECAFAALGIPRLTCWLD